MISLLKNAQIFYRLAVSKTFDVLGTGRTADTIAKKISAFLSSHPEINRPKFQIQAAEMAENKFNHLVAPYLKIPPVDVLNSGFRETIKNQQNQDDFQFFLHDLLHEILTPGSTKKFQELDNEFNRRQNETLEEMKSEREFRDSWETDESGEKYFSAEPRYELSHEVYSLEDFLEEQVAESLTNKNKISNNGLEKYVKTTAIGLINDFFQESYSQNASEFHPVWRWKLIEEYIFLFSQKVSSDVQTVTKSNYKILAQKFNRSFQYWLSKLKTDLQNEFEELGEVSVNDFIHTLLQKTSDWVGANFNLKQEKFKIFDRENVEFEPNEFGEKPIQNLTDEFKMSLARRWLLAVDKEIDKMIYSLQ